MDAAFLESTVAPALIQGLAATVEFQPEDSVEFLGRFLLKYAENEERKAKVRQCLSSFRVLGVFVDVLVRNFACLTAESGASTT